MADFLLREENATPYGHSLFVPVIFDEAAQALCERKRGYKPS